MDIKYQDIPELLKIFTSYWPSKYHIKMEHKRVWAENAFICVIYVRINDTEKGGEGEEHWLLEYANDIFKKPKEMELCIKRWHTAFAKAKAKPTLDILGSTNETIN
jgi:hypothetical protein